MGHSYVHRLSCRQARHRVRKYRLRHQYLSQGCQAGFFRLARRQTHARTHAHSINDKVDIKRTHIRSVGCYNRISLHSQANYQEPRLDQSIPREILRAGQRWNKTKRQHAKWSQSRRGAAIDDSDMSVERHREKLTALFPYNILFPSELNTCSSTGVAAIALPCNTLVVCKQTRIKRKGTRKQECVSTLVWII